MLRSKRLSYAPMKLEDVYDFRDWSRHKSNIYDDYNFYEQSDDDILAWFQWKDRPFCKYYSIFLNGKAIGYISFKNINKLLKTAVLGIVIDPGYISMGYGKEAMLTMLNVFFNDWNFKKLYLKVAKYNKRALALYRKLGFKEYATYFESYLNPKPASDDLEYIENKDAFFMIFGKPYFHAYKMSLDKDTFNEVVKCISNYKK
jgi:RimJ/RimL family protein N-acetyltransferase